MKFQALVVAFTAPLAASFAPPASFRSLTSSSSSLSKLAAIDPSSLHELPHHVDSLHHFFSSLTLADLDVDAVTSSSSSAVVSAPMDTSAAAADAAAASAAADSANNNGWFGFLTLPIEALLKLIHTLLTSVGMSADAWGVSIIAMTVVIKAATFPLTKSQLESTNKMQVRLL
jgi:YidC/Oxa1 family membrane protein insertase